MEINFDKCMPAHKLKVQDVELNKNLLTISKMITVVSLLLLLIPISSTVLQFNPQKLSTSLSANQFTFLYFYSSTCNHCKQFTPLFSKLPETSPNKGIVYAKIDGVGYKELTQKYSVNSYPSLCLFWKGIDEPIYYRKERNEISIRSFLDQKTKGLQRRITTKDYTKLTEQEKGNIVIYHGKTFSFQFNITSVLSYLFEYEHFTYVIDDDLQAPFLQIKGKKNQNFDIKHLKSVMRKQFAKVHIITEESWLKIHEKKQPGIIFIDPHHNKNILELLIQLAPQIPHVTILHVDPSQQEFRPALDALGVERQENILGVNELAQAKFMAEKPYTKESILKFVEGVIDLTWPVYRKTEKGDNKYKLTRENFDQKINANKDVLIFFYKTEDKSAKKFMALFKSLTEKLYENSNLSLLRCNLEKNELFDLFEFTVEHTPNIVFLRNRMKSHAIYFHSSVISPESIIEFIMENTTFDWEDEWSQL